MTEVQGEPGCYVLLDRSWNPGGRISFRLPVTLRPTRYAGRERYVFEYGPILLAAPGAADADF